MFTNGTVIREVITMLSSVAAVVMILVVLVCIYLTQPLLMLRHRPSTVKADAQRLRAHVQVLSESMVPRNAEHPDNLDRAAEYIREQLASAGVDASFQPFVVNGRTYRNVIGRIGPETKSRVVIGAHYDAEGPAIGADDNASGVAGLLELAVLLRMNPITTRVDLVAYTLEEPPFFRTQAMGSFVHADGLRKAGAPVTAMVSLEMIGFFSDRVGSQNYPVAALRLLYPSKGDFITVVGGFGQAGLVRSVKRAMAEATALPVRSMNAPRSVPGIDFSDQLNYWNAGYDAVMVTDTAFYRNANYHRASDTPDTLDYRRMAMVVEGVHAAVKAVAK